MIQCSVIIVNYNTFDLTVACIESVYSKTERATIEIVLVDNASSDADPEEFKEKFPQIILIKNETNFGFAKGNNIGIANSTGRYILLLNSDTVLVNDAVSLAMDELEGDELIGLVSGRLMYPDGKPQAVAGVFPSLGRELRELFRITRFYSPETKKRYYLYDLWDYSTPVEADWLWGAFLMFRREDLEKFPGGKLHDDFFMYYEDVQWCYFFKRVLKKKNYYSPKPEIIHYVGQSGGAEANLQEKYFDRILPNEYKWMRKTKGKLYARAYYLVKALYYLTLRRASDVSKARVFLSYALGKKS